MRITSYGAAGGVTGSKHLVEINGYRILLDCGMFQGPRKESEYKNRHMLFQPDTLDAVVLSHAHIDHSGVIPLLQKGGLKGKIHATHATRDLCTLMLMDSAHIQKKDAEWLMRKERTFVPPLYDDKDVIEVLKKFECHSYDAPFEVVPGVTVTMHDAGHVLGSAMVCMDFLENGVARRFLFTGDLGRKNMPILNDPWVPDEADVVMMESTYGDRDHDPIETMETKLAEIINRTNNRGGKVIIPTFALERAQEIVYALKRLEMKNVIPAIPVFVDSPLTVNITETFRMHPECFDEEISEVLRSAGDPFQLKTIRYITSAEESMTLNTLADPCIIMAASGMCEVGRILHHLRNHCENPNNTILIVGFQAKNTLGRRIVEREKEIRIFGVKRPLNAEVKVMNAFSAHAGRTELLDFGGRFAGKGRRVLLVHGEETALEALRSGLDARGVDKISIMHEAEGVEV
jgi:metallo-beta-lactamase family protein